MSQLCQQQEKILDVLALLVAQKDQTTKRLSSPSGSSATAVKSGDNQSRSSQSLPGPSSSEDCYPRSLPHSGPSTPSESSGFTPFRQPPSFASPSSQSIRLSPPFSNPTANQPRSSQSLPSLASSEDRYPRSLPHSGPSAPSESSGFTPFRQPPSFASPSSQSIGLSPPFSNPTASQPQSSQSLPSLSSSEDRYPLSPSGHSYHSRSGSSTPSESSPFRQPPTFASPPSQSIGLSSPTFSNPTDSSPSFFAQPTSQPTFASSRPLQSGHNSSLPAHPYSSGRTFRHSQTGRPLSSNPVFQEQTLSSGQVILTEQPSHNQGNLRPQLMQQQPCSPLTSGTAHAEYSPTPAFSDDFDFDWTGSDSDYLTSQSGDPETQWSTPVAYSSRDSSLSRSEPFASPSDVECVEIISSSSSEASRGVRPSQPALSKTIPQPPFKTPP